MHSLDHSLEHSLEQSLEHSLEHSLAASTLLACFKTEFVHLSLTASASAPQGERFVASGYSAGAPATHLAAQGGRSRALGWQLRPAPGGHAGRGEHSPHSFLSFPKLANNVEVKLSETERTEKSSPILVLLSSEMLNWMVAFPVLRRRGIVPPAGLGSTFWTSGGSCKYH